MNNAVPRPLSRWRIAGTLLLLLAVLISAGVLFAPVEDVEDQRAQMCRAIVPALHLNLPPVDVSSASMKHEGDSVHITYRLKAAGRDGRLRWVRCRFEEHPWPDDFPELDAVETDTGSLGDGRLFVLKRWWLDEPDFLHYIGDRRGALATGSIFSETGRSDSHKPCRSPCTPG